MSGTDTPNSYVEGGAVTPTTDGSITQSQTPNVNDFLCKFDNHPVETFRNY